MQDYLASGVLTMGQAKPLLALEDAALQREAADYIQEHELTARASEALVKRLLANPEALHAQETVKQPPLDVEMKDAQERLTHFARAAGGDGRGETAKDRGAAPRVDAGELHRLRGIQAADTPPFL